MHIMFIPSWYSNVRNKVHGSFFKEQALEFNTAIIPMISIDIVLMINKPMKKEG